MERALEQGRKEHAPVRVRAGTWTAQCPHCEAHDFHPADHLQFLACTNCGAHTRRTELLQQIARNAWLLAGVLAELSN